MLVLAMYFPQPNEFDADVFSLVLAYLVLCGIAHWMNLSVPVAAALMLLGCALALAPTLISASQIPVGSYDYARSLGNNNCSDFFLAITGYFHVGNGKLVAFSGMSIPLFMYAIISRIIDKWRRSPLCMSESGKVDPEFKT